MVQFKIYRHGHYINTAESEDALTQWLVNNVMVRSTVTDELRMTMKRDLNGLLKDAKSVGYTVSKETTEREWL